MRGSAFAARRRPTWRVPFSLPSAQAARAFLGVFAALAFVVIAASAAVPAHAHPADENAQIMTGVLGVTVTKGDPASESFDAEIALFVQNTFGQAVTLRGVEALGADRVQILQSVRIFGATVERQTAFLRLDPGESLILQPPDGRILVEGQKSAELTLGAILLRLDFGPDGIVELLARPPAD